MAANTERQLETLMEKKMEKKKMILSRSSSMATAKRQCHRRPLHQFPIHKLPFEILVEIFSRLSLHEISESKLICKDLHNSLHPICTDPIFITLHRSRLPVNPANSPDFILFFTNDQTKRHAKLYIVINGGTKTNLPTELTAFRLRLDRFGKKYDKREIVGASNGLVCLYNSDSLLFYLYNPFTKESLELPKASVDPSYSVDFHCGFAFDLIRNTFKIIVARHSNEFCFTGIEIYTLGVGSGMWKRIDRFYCLFFGNRKPILLNGALHWICTFWAQQLRKWFSGIVAVDICTETSRYFRGPSKLLDIDYKYVVELCLVCDCVSIVLEKYEYWKIWSLKNYGVENSWERKTVVKTRLEGISGHDLSLIGAINNVSLLFQSETSFYHNEKKKFQEIQINGVPLDTDTIEVGTFAGSLVSPKTLEDQARKEQSIKKSEEKKLLLLKN